MTMIRVLTVLSTALIATEAFTGVHQQHAYSTSSSITSKTCSSRSASKTALSAVLPPMIIGPMIKKMREGGDDKKSQTPLVDPSEQANEAPGLKIGKGAWKWPPIWPYQSQFFLPVKEAELQAQRENMASMTSMLSGVAAAPGQQEKELISEEEKFDAMDYWGNKQVELDTSMQDAEAIEKLKAHFDFYLRDGMSILEFGAGEDSYLPDDLEPSRHVGVCLNSIAMEKNPSLTQKVVVDLNKVVPDRDVDSDDLRSLSSEPFDAIIMTNTVDYLTAPREVFRSAWYLLKPGGIMIVAFQGRDATKDKFTEAQTKVWQQYNDDQHMWITGSFFQFSAGNGWDSLVGFDISPDSAKDESGNPLASLLNANKGSKMFVVQAIKGYQEESIDPSDPERSIKSLTWMMPVLESRDKALVVPRLARTYQVAASDDIRAAIRRNVEYLPKIYEVLTKMDQYAFTFGMQSQMAADLVSDPDFNANDEQMLALKQGLGLRTPSKEFWAPIGAETGALGVEEKINLLAHIVPRFGSGGPAQDEALQAFVTGLQPTYAVIKRKCPGLSETDVQLLGTELLAAEVLKAGVSTREEFAQWLEAMSRDELLEILDIRKSFPQFAKEQLAEFKESRKEAERQKADYKRLMEEQIETARKERSMIYNPRTRKMEVFDNPNKK